MPGSFSMPTELIDSGNFGGEKSREGEGREREREGEKRRRGRERGGRDVRERREKEG